MELPNDFELLLYPGAGWHIEWAARKTLAVRAADRRVCGFVFNGDIYRVSDESTVASILEEYVQRRKQH